MPTSCSSGCRGCLVSDKEWYIFKSGKYQQKWLPERWKIEKNTWLFVPSAMTGNKYQTEIIKWALQTLTSFPHIPKTVVTTH